MKDYYHFMSVERPIINTSLVLDPPFRYHVTDPTCNRANIRCMDFLRKVSSFQVFSTSKIQCRSFLFSLCILKDLNPTIVVPLLKFITIISVANLSKGLSSKELLPETICYKQFDWNWAFRLIVAKKEMVEEYHKEIKCGRISGKQFVTRRKFQKLLAIDS